MRVRFTSCVALAGYSFGAMVALRTAAQLEEVDRVVAIAPPLAFFDLSSIGDYAKPKLFVLGDRDQYCGVPQLQRALADVQPPKAEHIITGADHFFAGAERTVGNVVGTFAAAL